MLAFLTRKQQSRESLAMTFIFLVNVFFIKNNNAVFKKIIKFSDILGGSSCI